MNHSDNKDREKTQENSSVKPDQETLHTTDPQKNMEGPFSSTMHQTGHAFETSQTKEDADRKKDQNT